MWHFYLMTIELNNIQYPTDASGYLTNLNDWSVELAEKIAEKEQISLTAEHWEIIYLVRDFYQEYKTSPAIRMLVKTMAQKLVKKKATAVIYNACFLMVLQNKPLKLQVCQNRQNACNTFPVSKQKM